MTKRGATARASRGLLPCALIAVGGACTSVWMLFERGPAQIGLLVVGASLIVGAQGVAWALVSDVVPPKQRGTAMSAIIAFYSLGGIFAPLMLGGLVNVAATPLAGYQVGFAILGVILVVAALLAAWVIGPERNVAAFMAADAAAAVPVTVFVALILEPWSPGPA
ncbi:MFS transporter [Saccharopolyspora sp. NPDC050642]|uniref:MFS transporter n=1 Tax=Saccharopolyspora sp. NPDC050642 TaxID=3157099 RepID=UPI0033FE7E60